MENQIALNPKKTYTCKEIAAILGISVPSVYRLLDEQSIKYVKIGRIIRISKPAFDSWMEKFS